MDMKALAKSKRAHSLHHSKKHNPHQPSKAPSASSGDKKPTEKVPKEKPQQSHGARPRLPSNWDRYNEELELGFEDNPEASPGQPTEFVVPKSKGADYAYLISEAKAQAQINYPSEAFPSFESNTYSFTQDFGPMLAAKGHNILSWIADDSFEFESKPTSNLEAPFLSLDLNSLAEQLATAKLSERLFIEPDLLPPELLDDELLPFNEDEHGPQTPPSPVPADSCATLASSRGEKTTVQQYELPRSFPTQGAREELNSTKQINNGKQIKSSAGKPQIFEAANAEAELDMLLNSFNETKIFESSGASPTRNSFVSSTSSERGTNVEKPAMGPTRVDAAIDDLLEETSSMTKVDGIKVATGDLSKSKVKDDFDSWLDTI